MLFVKRSLAVSFKYSIMSPLYVSGNRVMTVRCGFSINRYFLVGAVVGAVVGVNIGRK